MDLNDVLNESKEAPATPEAPQAELPLKTDAPEQIAEPTPREALREKERVARGEDGKFVKKEEAAPEPKPEAKPEPKPEPPRQELTDKERALLAAMHDERTKRQALEKRMAELEAARKMPEEPPKPFYEDPEGNVKKMEESLRQEVMQTRQELAKVQMNTAEMVSRYQHPDFDEKISVFKEILESTPGVYQQWIASPNPAEFAYDMGKRHKELRELGSIDALKAKMEKEIRLRLEEEIRAKVEAEAKERYAIPDTLSNARGTNTHKPVWSGPSSLDSILGK